MSTVVPPITVRLEPLMGPLKVAVAPALAMTAVVPVVPRLNGALMASAPPVTRSVWSPMVRLLPGAPVTVMPLPAMMSALTVKPPVGMTSLLVSLTLLVAVAPTRVVA